MISIFDTVIMDDAVEAHVAPGGSLIYTICGERHLLGQFLQSLMLEVAYGMIDIECPHPKDVKVHIYFGLADEEAFKTAVSANGGDLYGIKSEPLPEGSAKMGYSMAVRNQIIQALL